MRRHLHRVPDVGVGQDALVVAQADALDLGVRPVRAVVGEGEIDRPDQREDVDREQQQDRRRDEQPGDGAVGERRMRRATGSGVAVGGPVRQCRLGCCVAHCRVSVSVRSPMAETVDAVRAARLRAAAISEVAASRPAARSSPGRAGRAQRSAGSDLAFVLEDLGPVLDSVSSASLRRALVGDDVVMHALLHRLQQLGVGRLGPEILHDRHESRNGLA